jgi:SAM-dependent methyltransferase
MGKCQSNVKLSCFNAEITSLIPKPVGNATMLDLGCGNSPHKQACIAKGYKYVGIDCDSKVKAMFLCDAHYLPFKNECFNLILSTAVIEHLRYPPVAMQEANRVLKPNGTFIGSAAFQEPFHGNSYTHYTHLGLTDLFQNAEFTIELLGANIRWNMLTAHASMSLFPGMPLVLTRILVAPLNMLHKLWWKIGSKIKPDKLNEQKRLAWTAGAFLFKLRKP